MSIILNIISCEKSYEKYEAEYVNLFDTYTNIIIYAENKEAFENYEKIFNDYMSELNRFFDIYNNYENINNIKTINDNAGIKPVKTDSIITELLIFSKEAYDITKGNINIAMGSVLKIWHEYREQGMRDPKNASVPHAELLKEAALHTDINSIEIDKYNNTIYIKDKDVSIDVGAVAKGFAAQKAAEKLKEAGVTSALINIGGNVCAIGTPMNTNESWRIGIQNPDISEHESSVIIDTIYASNCSVVTSGNYQRFYMANGKRYHHIISPSTLTPANNFKSVTVIHENSAVADMLSTALFIMPYKDGLNLADSYNAKAMWVFSDGMIKVNENYKKVSEKYSDTSAR